MVVSEAFERLLTRSSIEEGNKVTESLQSIGGLIPSILDAIACVEGLATCEMTSLAKKCLNLIRGLSHIKPFVKDTWVARTRKSAAKMKTRHLAAFQRFESLPSYLGLPSPGNCFKDS